jgi:polyribonucleotide nucleotidyltransferase
LEGVARGAGGRPREGLVHVSQLAEERVSSVSSVCSVGDSVWVKTCWIRGSLMPCII